MNVPPSIISPSDAEFAVTLDAPYEDRVHLWVVSISDPSNDDIRDIDHPHFEKYFGNAAECVFSAHSKHLSLRGAKAFCESIGMKFNPDLAGAVGG